MFRRAVPPPIDIPPLDESVLDEETRAGDDEIRTLEEQFATATSRTPAASAEIAGKDAPQDPMTQTVEDVKTLTRNNPEMASAVIRMWMAGKREE